MDLPIRFYDCDSHPFQRFQMDIHRPAADAASARIIQADLTTSAQHGAQKKNRRTHTRHPVRWETAWMDIGRVDDHRIRLFVYDTTGKFEHLQCGPDIQNVRTLMQHSRSRMKDRSRKYGKRGIFRSMYPKPSGEFSLSADDKRCHGHDLH